MIVLERRRQSGRKTAMHRHHGKKSGRIQKGIAAIALFAAGVWILSGCTGGTQVRESSPYREQIVLWSYYETDAQTKALDELMEGFNLSQDQYEASWQYVPMTEFTRKLTMAYTEKALPDLVVIDNPDMPVCIRMGMFEDVTEFVRTLEGFEDYYPSLMETVSYEERIYGLPFNCNNVALIYNKTMLEEMRVKPPKTWEELEEAAAALTQEGRSGFLMSAVEGEQGAFQILPWILSTGEGLDEIGGEGTVKAFSFIQGLVERGYMTSNCINLSQTDVARIFANGEAAMMENGPWVFPLLEEAGIDYGVSPLPADTAKSVIAGGENLGVLRGKNLEGAKAFLAYCNRDRVMSEFCRKACALPVKSSLDLGGYRQKEKLEVFREQMEGAVVRSSIPGWNSLSKELSDAVYQIVAGEATPERAAKGLRNDS